MKSPRFERIYRENMPDAPSWVDKLISPINAFMEQCNTALSQNLDINDNVVGSFITLTIKTPTTYAPGLPDDFPTVQFSWNFSKRVDNVSMAQISQPNIPSWIPTSPISLHWVQINASLIQVSYIAGLTANTTYQIKLLVL